MQNNQAFNSSYDELPYWSRPIWQTAPEYVETFSLSRGMPAFPATARILEVGCADGASILSIASRFPDYECVGLDFSHILIRQAEKHKHGAGLKNLRFVCNSVSEIDESYGKFDFIICHGLYSWVSPDLRKKILDVCRQNLTNTGIAYISYNTYPGWSSLETIRDLLWFHTQEAVVPAEKIKKSREILSALGRGDSTLAKDARYICDQTDSYIFHQYFDINHPLYFYEFITKASEHGLQFLAETHRTSDSLNIGVDIHAEQINDFKTMRRFRGTLLCRSECVLKAATDTAGRITNYQTSLPEKPKVSPLSLYQCRSQGWLTNQRQECVTIDKFQAIIVSMLDGTQDINDITKKILPLIETGELVVSSEDSDPAHVVRHAIGETLAELLKHALII